MRGEIIGVWSEMWRQVWSKLAKHNDAPEDLFCELYRELNKSFVVKLDPATSLAAIVDDKDEARIAFRDTKVTALNGELSAVEFLERAHTVIEDFGSEALTNRYFLLIRDFLDKYSLRYDLRRPFSLHPTLPGVFARLMRDLRHVTSQDAALAALMHDFEECVRDLKGDQSPRKVKQCISAQFNLLEALFKQHPDVVAFNATARREANTFGAMCDRTSVWPHEQIKESAKGIYRFANDYPGIRHAGTAASQLREIEMRDLVSVTIMLAGFTPYFTDALDAGHAYSD
ncbi:hypothetical protein [Celeribacter neptunius]|uniref:Uncharacterized protein n=1 Tax=Celeribacter neptunius TaxID=588602 RepID=A0A1I3TYJ8_9RHOB|nr:hypothetical protein [Celeribacter neptunius]SFJ74597.1 hypothetical protein SAMN04487991_2888 [Celeribacter neptunius]